MAKTSKTLEIRVSVSPDALVKLLNMKGVTLLEMAGKTITSTPDADVVKPAKVYDDTTCDRIALADVGEALAAFRGPHMFERLHDATNAPMPVISCLSSAESAARRDGRDYMFIVKDKAQAVREFIAQLNA